MNGTAVVTVGMHWGWGVVGVSPVAKGHIVNTYPKVGGRSVTCGQRSYCQYIPKSVHQEHSAACNILMRHWGLPVNEHVMTVIDLDLWRVVM